MTVIPAGDDGGKLFVADEHEEQAAGWTPEAIERHHYWAVLFIMMGHRGFYDVWKKHAAENGVKPVYVLIAHGVIQRGVWRFQEERGKYTAVQDWLDQQDGSAGLIILSVCNDRNRGQITTKQSLVVHPRGNTSFRYMQQKSSRIRLFIPGAGYVESGEALFNQYHKHTKLCDGSHARA